jgi:hypothetical protein
VHTRDVADDRVFSSGGEDRRWRGERDTGAKCTECDDNDTWWIRMSRVFVGVFVFLLLGVTFAYAEEMTVYVGEPATVVTACIRNSQLRANATAYIIIYDRAGNELVAQTQMPASGNGTFAYTYNFQERGSYSTRETCDFGDYLADGSTSINVISPMFGSVQVIAQSIDQVAINRTVKAEWLILLPNATNASESTVGIEAGACSVASIDGDPVTPVMTTIVTGSTLSTSFVANSDVGFIEAENYEISCNVTLSQGLQVDGLKNYVFVTAHMTYFQFLGSIFTSIGQVLGIVERSEVAINQTLSITNQTLQIVSNMNTTVADVADVKMTRVNAYAYESVNLTSWLTLGVSAINDADCNVSIYAPSGTLVVSGLAMNDGEKYLFGWDVGVASGLYSVREFCSGGGLGSAVAYGVSDVTVSERQVMMQVIG